MLMRTVRWLIVNTYLAALVMVPASLLVGCGESKENKTVVPDVPIEKAGQDSMDFYKSQMKNKKK